jgi:hypothetical protein
MSTYRFQLIEKIVQLSQSKDWHEARFEWHLETIEDSEDPEECLCGQFPINELCWLRNTKNGNQALVGNVCVHKFMGIDSHKLFDCLRKIQKDDTKALNADLIEYANGKGWINNWEHQFLLTTVSKRSLTDKQVAKRRQINRMIVAKVRRSAGTAGSTPPV